MANVALQRMTVETYLALEETATARHEFLNGEIFAMSGGTDAHDFLSGIVFARLLAALSGRSCAPRGPNLRIKSLETGLYTYADALVVCDPRFEDEKRTTLLNPKVVFEVLSESSEAYDRGDKFAHYRSIDSISEYVLVSTTARHIELYVRRGRSWELTIAESGDAIELASVDVRLAVDDIYNGVVLDPPRSMQLL